VDTGATDKKANDTRGLFDGFEGYRTVEDEDYRCVLTDGLIVPDANVLLNLYRYNSQARADLFSVLNRLGDHLWVPHQALLEFWRNREAAIRDPQDSAEKTIKELTGKRDQSIALLRSWASRVAMPDSRLDAVEKALLGCFDMATIAINELVDEEAINKASDTNQDPILGELELILNGRVGQPPEADAQTEAIKEGLRRIAAAIPPGYKDKNKDDEQAVGDYLVWEQVLCEAERRKCDVLLVTGDMKEDWWRRERGQTRGPRLELIDEMHTRAGVRLLMTQPDRLLILARDVLDVEVQEQSVQDIERVDKLRAADDTGGWTLAAIRELMDRLAIEGPVQAAAIHLAADKDGFVSREEVYELGGYDPSRTLRGFSRPANRIAQEFRDEGKISPSAVDVLEAVYDPKISSVVASGFRIPQVLIPLIITLQAADSESGHVAKRVPAKATTSDTNYEEVTRLLDEFMRKHGLVESRSDSGDA
jgi:hypothetical protein